MFGSYRTGNRARGSTLTKRERVRRFSMKMQDCSRHDGSPPLSPPARSGIGKKVVRTTTALVPLGLMLFVGACGGGGKGGMNGAATFLQTVLGASLVGVTRTEQTAFEEGLVSFNTVEEPDEGLGPVFNGVSCAECHRQGAVGGAGDNLIIARVSRIGAGAGASYSDLTDVGGPTIQARSLREFDPNSLVPPEVIPPQATHVSHRITTPLFGAGLLEAIPESELLKNVRRNDPDGITGKPNWITNPETNRREIGRFGWKSQISSLTFFAGDAYLNEMGVTSPTFPHDLAPQGNTALLSADTIADPEDDGGDIVKFAAFMRLLAPPSRAGATSQIQHGERLFQEIRCATCHVPTLRTGASATAALANREVNCYSDLLVHDMGEGLADGIEQGSATGNEFRTAPLWGLRHRLFYLHDGRATTIEDAIFAHSGEAEKPMERFSRLKAADHADLLAFLKSL